MNSNEPLSDSEVEALGYRITQTGSWELVDPNAKPPDRKGLCRMCSKFDAMEDGWCAGCLWFGAGDPHGVRQQSPEVGIEQTELPPTASRAERFALLRRQLKERK